MQNKTVVLLQAHNNSNYISELVSNNPATFFIIHIDEKSELEYAVLRNKRLANMRLLKSRVDVRWGGISQIEATLRLLKEAQSIRDRSYFHLMSGECIPLKSFEEMEKEWERIGSDLNFIESYYSPKHEWRLRAYSFHSNASWLRRPAGKIVTKIMKAASLFYDAHKFEPKDRLFGSQWWSINRRAVEHINKQDLRSLVQKFSKTACPDEHFFQYICRDIPNTGKNRRYIIWAEASNSPKYLGDQDFYDISNEFWFARKGKADILARYSPHSSNESN